MFYLTLPFKIIFNRLHYPIFYKEAQRLIEFQNIKELERLYLLMKDYNNSFFSKTCDRVKIEDRSDILRLTVDLAHYLYG